VNAATGPYEEVKAFVVGWDDWFIDADRAFELLGAELELAKAGALYADTVDVVSQITSIAMNALFKLTSDEEHAAGFPRLEALFESVDDQTLQAFASLDQVLQSESVEIYPADSAVFLISAWLDGGLPKGDLLLAREQSLEAVEPKVFTRRYEEFVRSPSGLEGLKELEATREKIEDAEVRAAIEKTIVEKRAIRTGLPATYGFGASRPAPSPEAKALTTVLGGLRAFPQADWDVIFDVRDRLEHSRVAFRGAISEAAKELDQCDTPEELDEACVALRRQVVAPALADIDAQLEELGVIDTLLRVAADSPTVGALGANLTLLAGDPFGLAVGATAHAVASAPLLASGLREVVHRRAERRKVAANPYLVLHEIACETTKRSS
jgi:hypothetical protein